MLFYANSLIIPPPYTIPLPFTERDGAFSRYGVRCFISMRGNRVPQPPGLFHYIFLSVLDIDALGGLAIQVATLEVVK